MHVPGGRSHVAVLDSCAGILGSYEAAAEGRSDDLGVAHRLECVWLCEACLSAGFGSAASVMPVSASSPT